jgi:hypothetical protein
VEAKKNGRPKAKDKGANASAREMQAATSETEPAPAAQIVSTTELGFPIYEGDAQCHSHGAIWRFRFARRDPTAPGMLRLLVARFEAVKAAACAVIVERRLRLPKRYPYVDFDNACAALEEALFNAMEPEEAPNMCFDIEEMQELAKLVRKAQWQPPDPEPLRPLEERRSAIRVAVREVLRAADPIQIMNGAALVSWQAQRLFDDPERVKAARMKRGGKDPRKGGRLPDVAMADLIRWFELRERKGKYGLADLAREMHELGVRDEPGSKTTPTARQWLRRLMERRRTMKATKPIAES